MVRHLSLEFLYGERGGRQVPESVDVCVAVAFATAHSLANGRRPTVLARVGVPFWVVQVSETSSIVLSAVGESMRALEFSENRAVSALRRVLSSEVVEPKAVPGAVQTCLELLGTVERSVSYVRNLERPSVLESVGPLLQEVEPGKERPLLETTLDSQGALETSSQFQQLRDATQTRIETMEQVLSLATERLDSHVRTLDNLFQHEHERWERRKRTQEEIVELEIAELQEKKQDMIYRLREKHRMDMRALTAEFAREIGTVEEFYADLVEMTRTARVEIAQMGENVEQALQAFVELSTRLEAEASKSTGQLEELRKRAEEVRARKSELEARLAEAEREAVDEIDVQIRDRKHRLVEFDMERDQKMGELQELRERVRTSAKQLKTALEERLVVLRKELRSLMEWALDNNRVPGLAPLTQVDINVFVVRFDDGDTTVLVPGHTPEERMGLPARYSPLSSELEDFVRGLLMRLLKESPAFEGMFTKQCVHADLLHRMSAVEALGPGLDELQSRQLLKEGVRERLVASWDAWAGKCPRCGEQVSAGVQFCPSCGALLGG